MSFYFSIIMSDLLQRIVTNEQTLNQIKAITSCTNCHKQSFECTYHAEECHKGPYCKQCIQSCARCSNRKQPIPYLTQLLQNVHVKCMFHDWGCPSIISFESLAVHESSCPFNNKKWNNLTFANDDKKQGSLLKNIKNDAFPSMDFVNPDQIQYPSEIDDHFSKSISLYRISRT